MMHKVAAFILVVLSGSCFAADWKPIEGIYAVTPEHYLDPSESEPVDSHYRVQIQGDSARDLFHAIKADIYVDDCTGAQAKSMGDMQCLFYQDNDKYECHFSINLIKQSIEYGVAC